MKSRSYSSWATTTLSSEWRVNKVISFSKCIPIPLHVFSSSSTLRYILNSVGAREHPCRKHLVTLKLSDKVVPAFTLDVERSNVVWSWEQIEMYQSHWLKKRKGICCKGQTEFLSLEIQSVQWTKSMITNDLVLLVKDLGDVAVTITYK